MTTDNETILAAVEAQVAGRDVYLWGARQQGFSMCRVLERRGIVPRGFIDSSVSMQGESVLGYPVLLPASVLGQAGTNPYIIITSGFFGDEISAECEAAGLVHQQDFVVFSEVQTFDYQVNVSGPCNLRCISCPQGNMPNRPVAGFMSAETYEKVLDKILREDPMAGVVTLYNWGEPLLNKDLPDIIRYSNERGVHTAVSSNLNVREFSEVVRAQPTWFRVSVSGYGANYEITHTGGKWDLFLENLHKLKDYRARFHPDMFVEVFYHVYGHNRDDLPKVRALCDELGFTFRFRHAALAPLENIEAVIEGKELTPEAQQTMDLQVLKVGRAMELAREQGDRECAHERYLWITWDLRVAQCMEWFSPDLSLVPGDFLSTPLAELAEARRTSQFCRDCKKRAIHRCYIVYGDEKLVHEMGSVDLSAPRGPSC